MSLPPPSSEVDRKIAAKLEGMKFEVFNGGDGFMSPVPLGQVKRLKDTKVRRPDLFLHDNMSLNGDWKTIIDPYETGFYDYRHEQRDLSANPSRSETFYLDVKPADPGERVEYDFDKSASLAVPGDWNTQRPELLYLGSC